MRGKGPLPRKVGVSGGGLRLKAKTPRIGHRPPPNRRVRNPISSAAVRFYLLGRLPLAVAVCPKPATSRKKVHLERFGLVATLKAEVPAKDGHRLGGLTCGLVAPPSSQGPQTSSPVRLAEAPKNPPPRVLGLFCFQKLEKPGGPGCLGRVELGPIQLGGGAGSCWLRPKLLCPSKSDQGRPWPKSRAIWRGSTPNGRPRLP